MPTRRKDVSTAKSCLTALSRVGFRLSEPTSCLTWLRILIAEIWRNSRLKTVSLWGFPRSIFFVKCCPVFLASCMMQFRTLCLDIIEVFVAAHLVARSFTAVQLSNIILKMLDDFCRLGDLQLFFMSNIDFVTFCVDTCIFLAINFFSYNCIY